MHWPSWHVKPERHAGKHSAAVGTGANVAVPDVGGVGATPAPAAAGIGATGAGAGLIPCAPAIPDQNRAPQTTTTDRPNLLHMAGIKPKGGEGVKKQVI